MKLIFSLSISISLIGRSSAPTTLSLRIYGFNRSNWTHANLVLVIVSPSGKRVSRFPKNCLTPAQPIDTTKYGRSSTSKSIISYRSSIRLNIHSRCAALCARRIQCSVMAGYGLEYTRSAIMFTHTCASVDATLPYDRRDGIKLLNRKSERHLSGS